MPELPEIETIRRSLQNRVMNRHISDVFLFRDDYLLPGSHDIHSVKKKAILAIERRGKFLAIHLSDDWILIHHLGMSGRLLLTHPETEIARHTHIRIGLAEDSLELRQWDPRRFGFVGILKESELSELPSWHNLGTDPFELKLEYFLQLLRERKQPIKSFLLDQRWVAGLGNIYADESLFRAGIHPLRPAGELTREEGKKLLHHIRQVLRESIAAGGSSTHDYQHLDGTLGEFQHKHRVYRRIGEPCRICKSTIERIVINGRSSHFCPCCQPIPSPNSKR